MEKHGVEIERKYIIMKPSVADVSACDGYAASEIEQIYLASDEGVTRRIRKRVTDGTARYYLTEKRRIDRMSADEYEREITSLEYCRLRTEMDPNTRPIYKTRHAFFVDTQSFEIDIYPEWRSTAIMETELADRDTEVTMPDFIRVVREVTGVRGYSNAAMSRKFPDEEKID